MNKDGIAAMLLLLLLLCSSSASDQVRFRVLSWEGRIGGLHYQQGEKRIWLPVAENRISSHYHTHRRGAPIVLFRGAGVPAPEAELPVASFQMPDSIESGLLVIRKDAGEQLSGMWLDDSFVFTPAGAVRVYNLSSSQLAVRVDDEVTLLDPLDSVAGRPLGGELSVFLRALVRNADAEWEMFYSLPVPVAEGGRTFVFFKDAADGSLAHAVSASVLCDSIKEIKQ